PPWAHPRARSTAAGAPASACGCWTGWWPNTTRSDPHVAGPTSRKVRWHNHDDGNRVLSVAASTARAWASHADRKIARARLARGRAGGFGRKSRGTRRASVDLPRRQLPPARYLARG